MFLRSEKAIEVNINIMRAFSAMRNFLMNNAAIFQRMDQLKMKQLDSILSSTGEALLNGPGSVSHRQAMDKAREEYRKFQVRELSPWSVPIWIRSKL